MPTWKKAIIKALGTRHTFDFGDGGHAVAWKFGDRFYFL
jgi:hypothetical protein